MIDLCAFSVYNNAYRIALVDFSEMVREGNGPSTARNNPNL